MKSSGKHLLAVTTTVDEITGEVKPLFSFPIDVCKATVEADVTLDDAAPSGAPKEICYIDTATGEKFEYGDRLRGVKVGDEFKPIPKDALEAIDEATKLKTMVCLGSMPLAEVDFTRATGTYFMQSPAKNGAPKSYRLVYEALLPVRTPKGKTTRPARALVTKRTARSRQKLCVIHADEELGCLVMTELRFAQDLRQPDEQILAPQTALVEEKAIDTARKLIDGMPDGANILDTEIDEAVPLRRELIEKAIEGEPVVAPVKVADTVQNDDLAAQLEASLAAMQ